jgi:hypothetical protein
MERTMKKSAYMPRTDEGKFLWLNNFAGKLQNHAATLGISQEQITAVQNDMQMMNYMINEVNRMKNGLAERVGYKDILISGNGSEPQAPAPVYQNVAPPTVVPFGIISRVSRLVRHIKSHENYNEAIGNDLGVIGSDSDESISDMKPLLNVKLHAGKPVVEWKKGHADSIDLYVNRGDGRGYVYLANDMSPHYTDEFPLPADSKMLEWRYKGIYRIKDEQVGMFSDEVGILVKKEVE